MNSNRGFTLVELIITIAIIGILAAIAIPAYVGQQTRAARSEAYQNLEALRLLEEQFFSENAAYAPSLGTCAEDNNDNVLTIQGSMPGFQPGNATQFSYCVILDENLAGAAATNCFRAEAWGNSGTQVDGDIFSIDCTNNKTY